jgi:hypothetical protein
VRKSADDQLAKRIADPGLRAWLLMNMRQDPKTRQRGNGSFLKVLE